MDGTWWVSSNQLDEDQIKVITAPAKDSHLILGPPGSGKSNLLLLRADFLERSGKPNSVILVFTRQLQDFMRSGCSHYSFDPDKIRTSISWEYGLLEAYDRLPTKLPDKFPELRAELCHHVHSLIKEFRLSNLYEYILLDEAQDYLPEEIELFRALANKLIATGDNNQKIYDGIDGLSYLNTIIGNVYKLKYHYRNGLAICRLADGIAKQTDDYMALESTSNYNEDALPSSVEVFNCDNHEEIFNTLLKKIELQLKAYPNEFIGVLTPRKDELQIISDYFIGTDYYTQNKVQLHDDSSSRITYECPIIVSTIHGAKGLEFRAVNLCFMEKIKKFPKQRNICFTGVTRAKTSLCVYHITSLPGYFEQAVASTKRPPSPPSIEELFVRR